jgi:hypothetical protein
MMFAEQIENALQQSNPAADPAWIELEQMATSSPETAVDLICDLSRRPLPARQRGWLAVGPLRTAIASANHAEEEALEQRAASDPDLATLLNALVRYEKKQRIVIELLEGSKPAEITSSSTDQQVIIPNVHEETAAQVLDQEAWTKIVTAIQAAPESQLFMLASTIVEPLLLRNETVFRSAILEQIRIDAIFRRALSYCDDLSFSEPFLDELIDASRQL